MEGWLKANDLPTRSELNSVHLRLRTLTARIAELEQQLAAPVAPEAPTAKPARAPRKRSRL
jgi:BMFP domain-containing protein YqiC